MKKRLPSLYTFILFVAISSFAACEKADSEKEYGTTQIYMPQAVVRSGGINNQYPVPAGTDSSTLNYRIDAGKTKLEIFMGAALSGPGSEAFSAEVAADQDTVRQLLGKGVFAPATDYVVMPVSMFTLPAKVEGKQGERAGYFNVSLDYKALKTAAYANKFLLLAVKFRNPSTYPLAIMNSAVLVIDVKKIP